MKRSCEPTVSKPKRVVSGNQQTSTFPPNAIPEGYIHLGEHKFAFVSDFANTVKVHIRQFELNNEGRLKPTRIGLSMSPALWCYFTEEVKNIEGPFMVGSINIVRDCLMVAQDDVDNNVCVSLQKYFKRTNGSRAFENNLITLNSDQWTVLLQKREDIDSSIESTFGAVFKTCVKLEMKTSYFSVPRVNSVESERVMIDSLIDLIKLQLQNHIANVLDCYGCVNQLGNQLGHDCITLSNSSKLSRCGNLAMFHLNIKELVKDFIEKKNLLCFYVNDAFLDKLDFCNLLQSAKDLYVASNNDDDYF